MGGFNRFEKFSVRTVLLILFCAVMMSRLARAQDAGGVEEEKDVDTIEAEVDGTKPVVSDYKKTTAGEEAAEANLKEPERLSDLSQLQAFSEVSVIQRRFLPKTGRFQFYLGLSSIANDPWFWGMGGAGRLGYHFTEAWALDFNYAFLSNSEKDAVKDLKANNAVNTDSIISLQNYLGVDVVWAPIYGKMSLFNKRIVPFDMYFSLGGGQASISNAKTSSAAAFHVGGGQSFAMSKGIAFRWDISWIFYNATPNPPPASIGSPSSESQFNNLLLTIGASFFFPEAKYR